MHRTTKSKERSIYCNPERTTSTQFHHPALPVTMKITFLHQALCILLSASLVLGQGYVDQQDYYAEDDYYGQEGDNLYHDYAAHQEQKAQGGNG
jgi:hypothetical protein